MEDIKKAIEENKFWRTFIKENRCWTPIADAIGKLAYNNGYNKAKKEFEESTRWRKVEEELPEMGIEVILKMKGGKHEIGWLSIDSDYYFDTTYSEFWLDQVESWKPIH